MYNLEAIFLLLVPTDCSNPFVYDNPLSFDVIYTENVSKVAHRWGVTGFEEL